MEKKELGLEFIWEIRKRLRAEGMKLLYESGRLWLEGDRLHLDGDRISVEGNKRRIEGDSRFLESYKLDIEGRRFLLASDKLWIEAVFEAYGNNKLYWHQRPGTEEACELETGEIFEPIFIAQSHLP